MLGIIVQIVSAVVGGVLREEEDKYAIMWVLTGAGFWVVGASIASGQKTNKPKPDATRAMGWRGGGARAAKIRCMIRQLVRGSTHNTNTRRTQGVKDKVRTVYDIKTVRKTQNSFKRRSHSHRKHGLNHDQVQSHSPARRLPAPPEEP